MLTLIEKALNRLETDSVLDKVTHHIDWVAPIVVIPKRDGNIRLCKDYKSSVETNSGLFEYSYELCFYS